MLFDLHTRTKKALVGVIAGSMLGGSVAGAVAGAHGAHAQSRPATVAASSTVPKPLTRAETAAEDVIGFLEKGQPARSHQEARLLRALAHGRAADALRRAGVPDPQIKAFQQRADHTARLSATGAPAVRVSLAANRVSQLMPAFYARYHDPVPASVLKLDYLDRAVQLYSQAGHTSTAHQAVRDLRSTWTTLRPKVIRAGGAAVARAYDRHLTTLERGGTAASIQKEALHGLDVVDQIETVFLGK